MAANEGNKREAHTDERNVKQALDLEQSLEGLDEADALYLGSLYENEYNDMTLQGVKSRVKQ